MPFCLTLLDLPRKKKKKKTLYGVKIMYLLCFKGLNGFSAATLVLLPLNKHIQRLASRSLGICSHNTDNNFALTWT